MSTPTPPPDGAALAAIRAEHIRDEIDWLVVCSGCRMAWPCDTVKLLAALDAERARVAALTAALEGIVRRERFELCWVDDCACDLCEADRAIARLVGQGRGYDGAPPTPAVEPWWLAEQGGGDGEH